MVVAAVENEDEEEEEEDEAYEKAWIQAVYKQHIRQWTGGRTWTGSPGLTGLWWCLSMLSSTLRTRWDTVCGFI